MKLKLIRSSKPGMQNILNENYLTMEKYYEHKKHSFSFNFICATTWS